ncbi:hypothetical protein BJV77DRAFT_982079, partial [Russula vinacea]
VEFWRGLARVGVVCGVLAMFAVCHVTHCGTWRRACHEVSYCDSAPNMAYICACRRRCCEH